jgi:hypothetical protein
MKTTITVTLSGETAELLELLTRGEHAPARDLTGVVLHLVHSAADGVCRPGAWERGWVVQAFGEAFTDHTEPDPHNRWRERPRKDPT